MAEPLKIISGGQTGVDRAALDVALALGLQAGGWCPKDRRCEDGTIPEHYPLTETRSPEFHVRTQRNVEASSATLVLTRGAPTGGTRYAVEVAQSMRRPTLVVDLLRSSADHIEMVAKWLAEIQPRVLNVAGPRESGAPGIARETWRILTEALRQAGYTE
ncbi:MAG: putative molybdenum carrier protein [Deltaproteobacteria bacterium]|nr:putative molybdenum carrier protein [Deltaproteobacteria bacterium]